ncbi:unnamed protein product [Ambrosiozyma monospora]|uniref:Unnamed protein product n=1 Tax=Ambrosiozyma monospora TaxID=43982 RepID=A0ACB5U4K0_AMBMO|nr:unnamed protein product [Ambrosiozyma monospora]
MLKFVTNSSLRSTSPVVRLTSRSTSQTLLATANQLRFNSSKSSKSKPTYRVNDASCFPEDAADATSTILADAIDFQRRIQGKDRVTWWEILTNEAKRKKEGKVSDSFTIDDVKSSVVGERTRADGFSFLTLPFKNDESLRDFYINPAGRLRFGHLFQDLDALAGRVAAQHCKPAEPMNVTASIDRIYVTRKIDEINCH